MAAQDYEQVTYNGPAGAQMGQSATEKISFYGATPVVQASTVASVTTATLTTVTTDAATSTTNAWGYSTSTQADAIVTLVNALATRAGVLTTQGNSYRTALINLGLIASA